MTEEEHNKEKLAHRMWTASNAMRSAALFSRKGRLSNSRQMLALAHRAADACCRSEHTGCTREGAVLLSAGDTKREKD